jgi:endopolyphosphatase
VSGHWRHWCGDVEADHAADVHPDPFYKFHSSPDGNHPCHRESKKGEAGYYGAETTDCDSPFTLVNATFQWIKHNIKDDIDFVVWTGDSARHDNDEDYPRNDKQVTDLNKYVVSKFVEVFGKPDNVNDPDPTNDFVVPIVPTFGNNDILPHNIFTPGPNRWTRKYEEIWEKFVPQAQRHSFARGGWFFTEVIPNQLAVFSLNTLYFFDSNSAVDGCDAKSEPGYEHMEWLRIQLQFLRQRGMKAILIGHVPPARTGSKQNWDETCYQKYNLWLRQYRDVIVTSIFGHMNIDHFMFQDVKDLKFDFRINGIDDEYERHGTTLSPVAAEPEFTIAQKADYLNELRHGWSQLPKPPKNAIFGAEDGNDEDLETEKKRGKKKKKDNMKKFLREIGGPWGERFSLSLVSPSVVPNYLPSLRIIEYNISGLEKHHPADQPVGTPADYADVGTPETWEEDQLSIEGDSVDVEIDKKRRKKHKHKKPKQTKFPVPDPPSKTSGPGPAYSPQSLSLLSWTQYYANLTEINAAVKAERFESGPSVKDKHFNYQVEYCTNESSVYKMKDLTVRSWLHLAQRIGRNEAKKADGAETNEVLTDDSNSDNDSDIDAEKHKKKKKKSKGKKKKMKNHIWRTFVQRAFVGARTDDDLDDDFGQPE